MQEKPQDYYDLLHVSPQAPEAVITASYRAMMQKLKMHPDLGGDAETAALINEAYAVLSDARRRAEYDASRRGGGTAATDDFESTAVDPPNPFAECIFCRTAHTHGKSILADVRCVACKSPLALAEQLRFEEADQRAVARVGNRLDVSFQTRWPNGKVYRGITEDLSLNGMRLRCSEPLAPGQIIRLECRLLDAVASVRNASSHRRGFSKEYSCGLAFVTLCFNRSIGGFVSDKA